MKVGKTYKQKDNAVDKIKMRTKSNSEMNGNSILAEWWKAEDEAKLAQELCGTASYLKTNQTYKVRQRAVDIRMYSGLSVYSYAGSNVSKMDRTKTLPDDRPTFNLVQAAVDTLVSRLSQNRPEPKFLTDGGDYKQRHLAQRLNQFMMGEFYQTKYFEKAVQMLRDCLVMGTGCLKIYEGHDKKVKVDRVMITDLYVDENDAINGDPQGMIQVKLMDRDKLMSMSDKAAQIIIAAAPNSVPDSSPDSGRTTSDQVMVVEGWKLASGPDKEAPGYTPGRHTLALQSGIIHDDKEWHKTKFPFVFMNYSDPFLGFFGQGIATQLFGTQMGLNRILYSISRMIILSTPKWLVEKNSGVPKAHLDNQLGSIVMWQGVKPEFITPPCNAPELYAERDKLIQYGFQQCGVSAMQATSQKPEGLDSGAAIRSYDDIATDRFASVAKKYDNVFVDGAYLIAETAKEIAEIYGEYQTVYPNKDGTKEIDLPAMKFLKDPFVIQCFTESALPRSPAGRIQTVTELVQAGILTIKEGARLMRFQDLEQNERLDNAAEERIYMQLDSIVEDGKFIEPDMFLDLMLAQEICVKYINLYLACKLEESKADMLRDYFSQVRTLIMAATPPPPQPMPGTPQANPQPLPSSPLVPNAVQSQPAA